MSIWNDIFDIYQSVQIDEQVPKREKSDSEATVSPQAAQSSDASDDQTTPAIHVFAYIDDGKGNITRNIAVEDRITILEMKNQELEHRYNRLLEQIEDSDDDSDD